MEDPALIVEFLEEAFESLTEIDGQITALKDSQDLETDVNTIFRPAHSIKGAASFFKLTHLMSMAHKLETVLDQLRKGERELSDDIIDVLSSGFFLLRAMVERGLSSEFNLTEEDENFLKALDELLESKDDLSLEDQISNMIDKISKGVFNNVQDIEKELQALLPQTEHTSGGSDHPEISKISSLIKLQLQEAQDANISQIKSCLETLESTGGGDELKKAIAAFKEDFNALVDSPVGIDEIMEPLLQDKLDALKPLLDKAQSSSEEPKEEVKEESEAKKEDSNKPSGEAGATKATTHKTIRVNVNLLEEIMNLVGELVLSRNQLNLWSERSEDSDLGKTTQLISGITSELQDRVMRTRLQPVSSIFNPLPGVVREISKKLNKKVELIILGKETELDRSVLEGIKDPLTHIIRNSLDHGLETPDEREEVGKKDPATLWVKAYHEGSQVVIEIKDNGRGVNTDKVVEKALEKKLFTQKQITEMSERQLAEIIFHPGFSTADQISQVSGRGVGMDVVKSNIQQLGGTVELDSVRGEGTTLLLKIPLTLAIIPALVVISGEKRLAIPQASVEEMVLLEGDDLSKIETLRGTEIYRLRGQILPLVRLNTVLENHEDENDNECPNKIINIIVLSVGKKKFGLIVDALQDMEEIVVKSLDKHLKQAEMFSGATIMGDGVVALILDTVRLAESIGLSSENEQNASGQSLSTETDLSSEGQVLIFTLSKEHRFGVMLSDVQRLETVPRKNIEKIGKKYFLQYRGGLLPIMSGWDLQKVQPSNENSQEVVIIVFEENGVEGGLMVESIEDVVPMQNDLDKEIISEEHFLGSSIINNKIITLFDLKTIARKVFEEGQSSHQQRILVWSDACENLKLNQLRDNGFDVTEVSTSAEANEVMKYRDVDIVVTDTNIKENEAEAFIKSIQEGKEHPAKMVAVGEGNFNENLFQQKLSSEQLLSGIQELLKPLDG